MTNQYIVVKSTQNGSFVLMSERMIKVNKELPIEPRQKFQVGDICKIVRQSQQNILMTHPPQPEPRYKDRECIILHTYAQVFWGTNFHDYSVYLLPNKNGKCIRSNFKGAYVDENGDKFSYDENEKCLVEYVGSAAWIQEDQFDFVRKPTQEEINIVIKEDTRHMANGSPYTSLFNSETKQFREDNGLSLFVGNLIKDGCANR